MEKEPPPPQGNLEKGPVIIAATSVALGFTSIFVALRLVVRIWITKSLWWDDWTILLAMVSRCLEYESKTVPTPC